MNSGTDSPVDWEGGEKEAPPYLLDDQSWNRHASI